MTTLGRAALAICLVRGKQWDALTATEQALYREDARAVLVALQEPSEAMVAAGGAVLSIFDDGESVGSPRALADEVYRAMIRAAGQVGRG